MGQGIPGLERVAEVGFVIQRLMLTYDGLVNLEGNYMAMAFEWS